MNAVMKALYAPAEAVVGHPERAYLVAGLFAALSLASLLRRRASQRRPVVVFLATFLWLLFGLNEERARAQGWDIRVDVLFAWPIVLAVSIWALSLGGYRLLCVRCRPDEEPPNP